MRWPYRLPSEATVRSEATTSSVRLSSRTTSCLAAFISDPDMAAVNVQNRVSQAQSLLPAEVTRVGVTVTKRQSSNVIMFALTTDDGRYDDQFVTNYALINVIPQLKRINGVGDVQSPSTRNYSMRIWLKPEKMKEFGLVMYAQTFDTISIASSIRMPFS